MAWIRYVAEDEAGGPLRRLYRQLRGRWGGVDNILRIHGLHPESMDAHLALYRTLMFGRGPLPRRRRELIALVVASANRCHY